MRHLFELAIFFLAGLALGSGIVEGSTTVEIVLPLVVFLRFRTLWKNLALEH